MTDAIAHRGPDASGAWFDPSQAIALGHRRLSILDLSELGAQPMASSSGRFELVFNGEIYNYQMLRVQLSTLGHRFRGHSDTEVLLAGFEQWGIVECIKRAAGMFAIAVWDRSLARLTLARDRLGEKPLYLATFADGWGFASELKALRVLPEFPDAIDSVGVAQLLRHGYIQAPRTLYAAVRKVSPGTLVHVTIGAAPVEERYWSASEIARRGIASPLSLSFDESVDRLDALLGDVVQSEMAADVPLGAFLSGGIDSSLIVALMQSRSASPVRTFTIGTDDARYDESCFAAVVAAHLGTDHTLLPVTGADALELVSGLPNVYDEPMADSSQLPTLLVSRLTRQFVTVALSGDGGDELFGGYQHYRALGSIAKLRARIPKALRGPVGAGLAMIADPPPDWLARRLTHASGASMGARPANALTRLGEMLRAPGEFEVFQVAMAQTVHPSAFLLPHLRAAAGDGRHPGAWLSDSSVFESRMLFDATCYLPDDILVKVDRAAMAYSLETRAPLLHHDIFAFAWQLPLEHKIADGVGKRILRELLYRYVPRQLVDRPKRGFSIPMNTWLRGALRDWAESLLSEDAIKVGGVLDSGAVRALWRQHSSGVSDHAERLWTILSLQAHLLHRR